VYVFVAAVTFLLRSCVAMTGGNTDKHRDWRERFMRCTVEMGSDAILYIPNLMKIGSGIQKLIRGIHRQHDHRISLHLFFQNKENWLKIIQIDHMLNFYYNYTPKFWRNSTWNHLRRVIKFHWTRSHVMWDLLWTKWHWGMSSPRTSVSPAHSHSTKCSLLIYHLELVQ
jgi:hypothetical protein